ncbi:MAG: DUF2271 domain-containing protein [Candidatus Firestonebacteria bacterium]
MKKYIIILSAALLVCLPGFVFAALKNNPVGETEKTTGTPVSTPGKLTITYTRSSEGKNTYKNQTYYKPYRVAVWIEDAGGKLLKTLYRSVGGKIDPFPVPLENWEKKSGKISNNTPDAYTGASSKGGTPEKNYSFSWDFKDEDGNIFPDGSYIYCVEVARYYQNGKQAPWRSGGPKSSLNSGVIKKGKFVSFSSGRLDSYYPPTLTSLSASFAPK